MLSGTRFRWGATAALALLLAPTAPAQVVTSAVVETFEFGSNEGGWVWFGSEGPVIAPTGGNPGAYLTAQQYTSPGASIRTTEGESAFTGDLRARGVTGIGVDFASFLLQEDIGNPAFDAYRFTVFLGNDAGTPTNFWDDTSYYLKTDLFLPLVGEGWISYDVPLPSQADALPADWQQYLWPGAAGNGQSWPEVMSDVSYVWLMYNDPNGFYIFANWILGADSIRVLRVSGNAFEDLGFALAGTRGPPTLAADSLLVEGADISVQFSDMLEDAPLSLVVGFAAVDLPFKGGVLVPDPGPPGTVLNLATGPAGSLQLHGNTPPGLPLGQALYLQGWIVDPAGSQGMAATNAVRGTVP